MALENEGSNPSAHPIVSIRKEGFPLQRLAYSTITTTLDIYAHVTPGMQKEATLRFDEALKQGRAEGAVEAAIVNELEGCPNRQHL